MSHHFIAYVSLRRLRHLLLCGLLLLGLLPAWAAHGAQNGAITLDVQAGFDSAYRADEWFPIDVQVANDGADVRGVLEWRFPGQNDETQVQQVIELPRGARKRVTLYAFSRNFARNGEVRLLDGSTVLAKQAVQLDATEASIYVVGVASSDPALLNSLNSLKVAGFDSTTVQHFGLAALPDRAAALATLNALYLHDVDTSALRPSQRAALELWVQQGGQLIVSGGVNGPQTAAGVATLLPVELDSGVAEGSLAALGQLSGRAAPDDAQTTLNLVRPRPGATPLASDTGSPALVYRQALGNGNVLFTTFDLAKLRGWTGEINLWKKVLTPWQMQTLAAENRQSQTNLLQNVLEANGSALPSAQLLLLLLAVYLIIVGPVNYLLLRRFGRLDWAWLTIPVVVVFFSAAFYLVGFGLRGRQSHLDQIAIVNASEGQPRGMATAFIGLFSPSRARYTVQFPADTLVSDARSWRDIGDNIDVVRYTDAGAEVADVLVDVGSVRTLVAETAVDVPVNVQSAVQMQNANLTGTLQNTGTQPLEDAIIVRNGSMQSLGTIAPGQTSEVSLDTTLDNVSFDTTLAPIGPVQRNQLVGTLFQRDSFQSINDTSIYLLSWSREPAVPLNLNDEAAQQESVTLYIVRLAGT